MFLVTYHFYALTDFMTDPQNRFYTGYSLVACIILDVIVYLGTVAVYISSLATRKLKLKYMAMKQAYNKRQVMKQR